MSELIIFIWIIGWMITCGWFYSSLSDLSEDDLEKAIDTPMKKMVHKHWVLWLALLWPLVVGVMLS